MPGLAEDPPGSIRAPERGREGSFATVSGGRPARASNFHRRPIPYPNYGFTDRAQPHSILTASLSRA